MDPPEAREGTRGIQASAGLRISKYGLKASQGQTDVIQNPPKFTGFTHLILQRKECDIFISRITVLRYLSQMVWDMPCIGTVYSSYQVGKLSNAVTSFTQIWFCYPIQFSIKPVFCRIDYTDTSTLKFHGVSAEIRNNYQVLKTEFLKHAQHKLVNMDLCTSTQILQFLIHTEVYTIH